jgi:hypothetical protein
MRPGIDCAFERNTQSLRCGVERHLRAIETQREALGRAPFRKLGQPVGPLDHADILNERHVEKLVDSLETVFPPLLMDSAHAQARTVPTPGIPVHRRAKSPDTHAPCIGRDGMPSWQIQPRSG